MKKLWLIIIALIIGITLSYSLVKINNKPQETINTLEKNNAENINNDIKEKESEKPLEMLAEEKKDPKHIEAIKEINGFILLKSMDKDLVIDLRYATTNNFTKQKIYPDDTCVLRKSTAEKLIKANDTLKKLGYKIKIWDAYRPIYVQRIFWNIVKDSRFVANPENGGSIHNKGCAVDITLVDKNNNELIMPSKFDDFSENAYRSNSKMSQEAKKNMDILTKVMAESGFTTIDTEWWHFDDRDSKQFKSVDVDLSLFNN